VSTFVRRRLRACRPGALAISRVLILALIISLFPLLPASPAAGTHGVDLMHNAPSGWASKVAGSDCAGPVESSPEYACDGDDTQGGAILQFCNTYTVHGESQYACGGSMNFERSSGATSLEFRSLRFKIKVCTSGWPNEMGFGRATLDESSGNYAAIRGREQQLIDYYRSEGLLANRINGVSARNPDRDLFMDSAQRLFGDAP
jgi:hypothetical protein